MEKSLNQKFSCLTAEQQDYINSIIDKLYRQNFNSVPSDTKSSTIISLDVSDKCENAKKVAVMQINAILDENFTIIKPFIFGQTITWCMLGSAEDTRKIVHTIAKYIGARVSHIKSSSVKQAG